MRHKSLHCISHHCLLWISTPLSEHVMVTSHTWKYFYLYFHSTLNVCLCLLGPLMFVLLWVKFVKNIGTDQQKVTYFKTYKTSKHIVSIFNRRASDLWNVYFEKLVSKGNLIKLFKTTYQCFEHYLLLKRSNGAITYDQLFYLVHLNKSLHKINVVS